MLSMEKDKGKKPINEEEEEDDDGDDFLQLLMGNFNELSVSSSPFPPLPPKRARNSTQNNLLTNAGETSMLHGSSLSSSSSGSSSKEDSAMQEILEKIAEDDFIFKYLTMSNDNTVSLLDIGGSSRPPLAEADSVDLLIVPPPELALQSPAAVARAAATKSTPRRRPKKAMPPEKLAELAMQDPKKAKRIIANRMSAVRAKEKKKLYTHMLEHKIQTLNSESAALKAHLTLIQTESTSLNSENVRLKEQTSMILHQLRLQDSLNEEMRNEIIQLRILTQMVPRHGMMLNNTIGNSSGNISSNLAWDHAHAPLPLGAPGQFLHYHHQVPIPFQVDQVLNGVERMNHGQQYPWQVQPDHQIQQANQFEQIMQQQQQHQNHEHQLQYEEEEIPYHYRQQREEISPLSDHNQETTIDQDPDNIATPPYYSGDDQESNDE